MLSVYRTLDLGGNSDCIVNGRAVCRLHGRQISPPLRLSRRKASVYPTTRGSGASFVALLSPNARRSVPFSTGAVSTKRAPT